MILLKIRWRGEGNKQRIFKASL